MSTKKGKIKQEFKAELARNTALEKREGYAKMFFLVLLSGILFFPPFLRGLFFEKEQFVVEIFIFLIFILFCGYKFIKKDYRFIKTPVEVASLGLLLLYLLSIIYAVSTRDAISESLKYCMYFSIFIMLSELLTTFKLRRAFLWFVSMVAVLLCLTGIDGAAGSTITNMINQVLKSMGAEHDLFFDLFKGGRIYSSLQYPNALAAYIMATFVIMIGLGTTYTNRWIKGISSAISSLFFLTFILTFSRGAYILLPVAAIILLFALPKGGKVRTLTFGLIPVVIVVPFSLIISRFMGDPVGEGAKVWGLTFACIAASGLVTFAYNYVSAWFEKINWKVYISVFACLLIITGIGAVIATNSDSALVLEHSENQSDSDTSIQKSLSLKPDNDYTLQIEVEAYSLEEKPYTYQIAIDNKDIKDILMDGQQQLALLTDKNTSGTIVKKVDFTVPKDSKAVNITFRNFYQGTKVVFKNAVIIDKNTNNIVKRIKLNYKYIPQSIAQRFENLGADKSSILRQVYFIDAGKMIKDRWLLGGGGKAWEKLYYSYQSYGYSSTQAHNYILQVAIEVGVVGIIILIMLVFSIIYMFFKQYAKDSIEERIVQASLLTAILCMLIHSAMDFDLSLSAVYLLLWQLLAVYNSKNRYASVPDNTKVKPILVIITLLGVICFPIAFRSASSHLQNHDRYVNVKNIDLAVVELKKAVKLDPINGQYNIRYLSYLLAKKNVTAEEMDEVASLTEQVEKASALDADLATKYATCLLTTGNVNKGMKYIDLGIKLRPQYLVQWKTKVNACYQIAMKNLSSGDFENSLLFVNKGLNVIAEARQVNKLSMVPFPADVGIMDNLEKLMYIKNNILNNSKNDKSIDVSAILFYNIPSIDINLDEVPDQWTTDKESQIKLSTGVNGMIVSGQKGFIQSRPLDIKAGKKYQINVKLQKLNNIDKIPFSITEVMGGNEFLQFKDGKYSAIVEITDSSASIKGSLRLELPDDCVVQEVLVLEID